VGEEELTPKKILIIYTCSLSSKIPMTSFDLQKNEQTCQTFRENIENEKGKEF